MCYCFVFLEFSTQPEVICKNLNPAQPHATQPVDIDFSRSAYYIRGLDCSDWSFNIHVSDVYADNWDM